MDFFRDWFRTLLSLTGVCVGIFSIVAVFTLVDSLQSAIREGFEKFGTDMVFIEREPLEPDLNEDGVFRWWEYASRPAVTYAEYLYLKDRCTLAGKLAFSSRFADVTAVGGDWETIVSSPLEKGRPFSEEEMQRGSAVVLLGCRAAEELFEGEDNPVGRSIRIAGMNCTVAGVFRKCGANTVSTVDIDGARLIPVNAARRMVDLSRTRTSITAAPLPGAENEEFTSELRRLMRQYRRLTPFDKDNFAINRISFVIDQMTEIFRLANMLGWIIGLFSLLVGGFGIANIMFVSVQERTPEIGIQKALGASRRIILFQYLKESVILSALGGLAGILLVGVVVMAVPSDMIELSLSAGNVAAGLLISFTIGVTAGLAPAVRAANLRPVDAINAR